jgi:PhzF family phenazine biosynthesis protein
MTCQHLLRVFTDERGAGGNPTLVIDGADAMSDAELIDAARRFGGECTCIFDCEAEHPRLRFFFPTGEMAFCGHGTLGAATILRARHPEAFAVRIGARSIQARVRHSDVEPAVAELTTPLGTVSAVDDDAASSALAALGLPRSALSRLPVLNAGTERPKTLLPLASVEALDAIATSEPDVLRASRQLASTGLYPFVVLGAGIVEARQFPAGAGFLEDPATVTAAISLATAARTHYAAAGPWTRIEIRQGRAMGKPSKLLLRYTDHHHVVIGGRIVSDGHGPLSPPSAGA